MSPGSDERHCDAAERRRAIHDAQSNAGLAVQHELQLIACYRACLIPK